MDEKGKVQETMRQVLEMLETELAGRRVFRYMEGEEIREIYGEQFFRNIRETACLIRQKQLEGKKIGIIGKNSYEWIVNLCGIFWTGSVAVLLDREISAEDLREYILRVDLKGIFFDDSAEKTVREADIDERLIKISSADFYKSDGKWTENETEHKKKGEDLACIFFTSGTTGKSKAVMMSENGVRAGICNRILNSKFEAMLAILPFHHLSGFSPLLNALYLGAEVCIAGDLKYFYQYLEVMKPDYVFVVPSMLRMLARKLKQGGPNGRDLGWNLQIINCGGASFCGEFLKMLLDHNIKVYQGYGASEAGAIGFFWEMTLEHPDTIGKPPEELEIKIQDGELYLKSKSLMMGYYGEKEETEKVLREGWYATGDLCRMDEEGYVYLTGRKKNLIILSNGENVSPEEIERKLYKYEDICEATVGEEDNLIAAFIFPRYPEIISEGEKEEIKARIRRNVEEYNQSVPIYKQIQKIHFLEEPGEKTSSGKIKRQNFGGKEDDH